MTTTTKPGPVARPGSGSRLLPHRWRKAILVVHVVAAGAWIGIDVMVAILVSTGMLSDDPATQGLAYQALGTFVVVPMLVSGLVSLVTGLLLGLGTKWGLVRYWWVAVKLVANVVLCILIVVALQPGMAEVRAHGEALGAGLRGSLDAASLIFPPVVSLTVLTFATVLSVFKPWGRLRRSAGRVSRVLGHANRTTT